jgi:hypothetical protein
MPPEKLRLADAQSALYSLITGRQVVGRTIPSPASFIVGDTRASAGERVAVYAFMYRDRLREALEAQFPRLAELLGSDDFVDLAYAYVDAHPSRSPSLRFLGAELASWLDVHRPERPELAALAALEWARADIFDLLDERVLALDAIRAWPRDRFAELPLASIAAHRLLTVRAGTIALWRSIENDESVVVQSTTDPDAETSSIERVLVWRQGVAVFHRAIDADEEAALARVAAGTTLGQLCEPLASKQSEADASEADASMRVFGWVWTWANDGLLVAV